MTFTKDELLTVLNIEISADYASIEVEIKESLREFNEQTNIDRVMWENDKAENIIVDEKSKYYIIRETVSAAEVIYRFSGNLYNSIITGKAGLKKEIPRGDEKLDFPYSLTKRFEEPRRIFYLDQPVGQEPYGE